MNGLFKKPESEIKPEGVTIQSFQFAPLPGAVAGQVAMHIYGLGSDERIYYYTAKGAFWTLLV